MALHSQALSYQVQLTVSSSPKVTGLLLLSFRDPLRYRPQELSERNVFVLASRASTAKDMLSTLKRRTYPSEEGLTGYDPEDEKRERRAQELARRVADEAAFGLRASDTLYSRRLLILQDCVTPIVCEGRPVSMELQQKRFRLLLFFSTPAVLDFMFKVASSEDILFREGLPRFYPFLYSRILALPLSHRIIPHALSTSSPTDFSRKAAPLDIPCTSPLLHGWNHDNHFYPN